MRNALCNSLLCVVAVLAFGAAGLCATGLRAQGANAASPPSSSVSMTPHRLPTDTGRMVWGHQDYSHYTTPDPCDRAILDAATEVWRTRVTDTLEYVLAGDTLPSAAKAIAHTCGTQFTVDAPQNELWSVMRISLALNNDAQAARVVERQVMLAKTVAAQAETYATAINTYLGAHPPRLEASQALLKRLDALGPRGLRAQFGAHSALMDYWRTVYNPDSMRTHANTARSLALAMSHSDRDDVNIESVYATLLWLENDAQNLVATQKLLTDGRSEVGNWRNGLGNVLFAEAQRLLDLQTAVYGKKTRALTGSYSYNLGGKAHPAPGTMSLLVKVDHSCGPRCIPLYAILRQLHTKYGAALDITLLTETRGFAPGTGPLTVPEEAKFLSYYYLDSLKIPAALLVDESPVSKAEDGHLEFRPSAIGELFNQWALIDMVLIDRVGKVQWLGSVHYPSDRRMTEAAIDRVVHATDTPVQKSP